MNLSNVLALPYRLPTRVKITIHERRRLNRIHCNDCPDKPHFSLIRTIEKENSKPQDESRIDPIGYQSNKPGQGTSTAHPSRQQSLVAETDILRPPDSQAAGARHLFPPSPFSSYLSSIDRRRRKTLQPTRTRNLEARSLKDGQISTIRLHPIYRWRSQNISNSNHQSQKKLVHIPRLSDNQICRISTACAIRSQS